MRRRLHSGFTLLEVLLAVSLVIMLSAGIYTFYANTLETRDHVRRTGQVIFAQRRIMDIMAREITSARSGLEGTGDTVSFMRTAVPGRAVFLAPNITRTPSIASEKTDESPYRPQHDIQLVSYRLNRCDDEIGGLERTCLKNIKAEVVEEGSDIEVVLLTEHVKFIHLQYWDGSGWSDSWTARALPQAVRIRLGAEPLPEDTAAEDYTFDTICRVVAVPAGLYQPKSGRSKGTTGRSGMFTKRGQDQ